MARRIPNRTGRVVAWRVAVLCLMLFVGVMITALALWRSNSRHVAPESTSTSPDLVYPAEDWRHFTDPFLEYSLWLPPNWRAITSPPESDATIPTYFCDEGLGCRYANIGVMRIIPVNLLDDAREPGSKENGEDVYPQSVYTITVANASIACARYVLDDTRFGRIHEIRHVCVVPEPRATDYDYYVALHTDDPYEGHCLLIWQSLVQGFYREQNPK